MSSFHVSSFILVECFDWFSYVDSLDCKQKSLLNNKWVTDEELAEMEEATILDTLIKKLSKYYDSNVHSEVDLRMREETSDKGSLCGMAAVYQAGLQTLFSISEIKQMSYNDVKTFIGEVIGLGASDAVKESDISLLKAFHDEVCSSPVTFTQMGSGEKYKDSSCSFSASNGAASSEDCCTICALESTDIKWISWKSDGSNCQCRSCDGAGTAGEPNLKSGTNGYERGSCSKASKKRKKRETELGYKFQDLTKNLILNRNKRQTNEVPETEDEIELRSYGSKLRYECGIARKFYNVEAYEDEDPFYSERWMQCNWNNSWTQYDTLDDCVWVQCLYPPEPPSESLLMSTWSGDPVDFYDNVTYVCAGEDLYFEWDREMVEYNISCLPGGAWDKPIIWPICVPCKIKKSYKSKIVF